MRDTCQGKTCRRLTYFTTLILGLSLLPACGGGGDNSVTALGGGFSRGEVRPLEFDPSGEAIASFGELSGGEEFAVILFAANVNEGNFNVELKSALLDQNSKLLESRNPETESPEEDPETSFHERLREEEEILGQWFADGGSTKDLSGGRGEGTGDVGSPTRIACAGGAGILINVLNSLNDISSYASSCAVEKRRTGNAVYYVDESAQGFVPDSTLNALINEFESKIAVEREYLGMESDVDGDGHFNVYFTPAVNRLGMDAGGYITGFFYGSDLFPKTGIPASNEMEILYMSIPDPTGKWGVTVGDSFWINNIAPTVLTHEYQHMINFNHKVLLGGIGAEQPWANEGLSHLLEDLSTQNGLSKVSAENPSRVALFLSAPEKSPFTGGTSLAQRGGSYLFFRYLCEQSDLARYPGVSSCRELLKELIQSEWKGVDNIERVTGWPFRNLLLDFYATLQLSDTGITADPRYNFQGICLTCAQDDNRGTVLNGISVKELPNVPVNASVSSPGGLFYNIFGKTITKAGNALNFVAQPGMIPGGAIIRLQ